VLSTTAPAAPTPTRTHHKPRSWTTTSTVGEHREAHAALHRVGLGTTGDSPGWIACGMVKRIWSPLRLRSGRRPSRSRLVTCGLSVASTRASSTVTGHGRRTRAVDMISYGTRTALWPGAASSIASDAENQYTRPGLSLPARPPGHRPAITRTVAIACLRTPVKEGTAGGSSRISPVRAGCGQRCPTTGETPAPAVRLAARRQARTLRPRRRVPRR
jgi:hypothetical protein